MELNPKNIARIRRELDLDDPQTLTYFGTSPQRRLGRLSRSIAGEDTVDVIDEVDKTLHDALQLLSHKPTRWLDPFLRFVSLLPVKTPERRYEEMGQRLGEALSKLQAQRVRFAEWQNSLDDIQMDLSLHIAAGEQAEHERQDHQHLPRLQMRLEDLRTSLEVVGLVGNALGQRRNNYALLTEQLNSLLGTGSSAWQTHRAILREKGTAGFQELRELAEACQAADKSWREQIPDEPIMTD